MTNRYLPTPLRRALEKTVKDARLIAEEGARDAIRRLGVADSKAPSYLADDEKELRRRLRAHARALGDAFDKSDETQETKRLVEAAAYAHWHRMLFARFLAERSLLRNPEYDVPVSLEDCRELAEADGLTDPWIIAERYAASMLPAVFRIDDPVLSIELDPVQTQKLHRLVTGLDTEVFQAEDSLGWTYQFWRAAEKDAVNRSGVKIGADELPAVTQLFTEPYMVRFLLHNTLGAWWAGRVLAANPELAETAADEDALRAACSLPGYSFDMLRLVRDGNDDWWRGAAGTFPGWPSEAKAITMLDPCCGSGHFLTEALSILAALRQTEEGLSCTEAVAAVLRDNLHGLEIDGRCVQIAAFAVALTAWRIGGWQKLPQPHIAWVGAPPPLPKREFVALADGVTQLEYALAALHDLFAQAPILGSLLESSGGDLFEAERLREIERILEPLLAKAREADPDKLEGAIAARGMADAAELLHRHYTIQSTNVPYLGIGRQNITLADFLEKRYAPAELDLCTALVFRMQRLAEAGGTVSTVIKQEPLFLGTFQKFRQHILTNVSFDIIASLGSRAFETISGEVVNACLLAFGVSRPEDSHSFSGLDVASAVNPEAKGVALTHGEVFNRIQAKQLKNPNSIIVVSDRNENLPLLSKFAKPIEGAKTIDIERLRLYFWEPDFSEKWWLHSSSPVKGKHFSGLHYVSANRDNGGPMHKLVQEYEAIGKKVVGWRCGQPAWGKIGISVAWMGDLPACIYVGSAYDNSAAVFIVDDEENLPAVYAFLSSNEYVSEVRKINSKYQVATTALGKVPFDINLWKDVAAREFPNGIPSPYSEDPKQWLFHGYPPASELGAPLHVALARLCGYRWPSEIDPRTRLSNEARAWIAKAAELPACDNDGLLGVPTVAGEKPLADRLRAYLAAAFDSEWSDALERRLVTEANEVLDKKDARDSSLETWVRDRAFRQHCALFGQRPFLWHISDGLKDGFSVFVHYHRFDQANLRKLTYTLLGDWLARANAENNALRYEKGRELQQKLEKILEGENPYDIYVRWKSLAQQPLGWDPDLDDGVRQNIRPFVMAGVLTRDLSKILKGKDRGQDVASAPWHDVFNGERRNDHHTTLAEKRAAREAAAKRVEAAK